MKKKIIRKIIKKIIIEEDNKEEDNIEDTYIYIYVSPLCKTKSLHKLVERP